MDRHQFEKYISETMSSGFITLAIAIGTDTGLFKVMCHMEKPESPGTIADIAGLKERYVTEWLGAMVAAKIVQTDANNSAYSIPLEYRDFLLKGGASFSSALPTFATKHQEVVSVFRNDGLNGFDYSDHPLFFKFLNEYRLAIAGSLVDEELFPQLPELGDKLGNGGRVCDIGCGTGVISVEIAKRFLQSTIIGVDSSEQALETARGIATKSGVQNVDFVNMDITQLPDNFEKSFDWVLSYVVLHDLPNPTAAVREIRRVLKDDGLLSIVESEVHSGHNENAGNLRAAQTYTESMYVCLPCGLSNEPFEGFGGAWGVESICEFLETNGFTVQSKGSFEKICKGHVHIICKKKSV